MLDAKKIQLRTRGVGKVFVYRVHFAAFHPPFGSPRVYAIPVREPDEKLFNEKAWILAGRVLRPDYAPVRVVNGISIRLTSCW